jgi:hypothetical protein
VALLLTLAFLIGAFIAFDVVVRAGYAGYTDEWEASGSPHGFFWVPDESRGFLGLPALSASSSRNSCMFEWLVSNPSWVSNDRFANAAVWLYRLLFFGWLACVVRLFFL